MALTILIKNMFFLQYFVVSLVNPKDGAAIGDMDSVTITINKNDDINGVFSFDMDSVLVSTQHSVMLVSGM